MLLSGFWGVGLMGGGWYGTDEYPFKVKIPSSRLCDSVEDSLSGNVARVLSPLVGYKWQIGRGVGRRAG